MSDDNVEQKEFWEELLGPRWLARVEAMDRCYAPMLDHLLAAAALKPGMRVLDIGCGPGVSTFAAADIVGPEGHVTGADISRLFVEAAEARATSHPNVSFVLADAQSDPLEGAPFDALISRLGMMFFADPRAALAHLRSQMAPGARATFICWDARHLNPWFNIPFEAAAARFGQPPRPDDPFAPGPFAFRKAERVTDLLAEAGWSDPRAEEARMTFPLDHLGDARGAAGLITEFGPAKTVVEAGGGTIDDLPAVAADVAQRLEGQPLALDGQLILYSAVA